MLQLCEPVDVNGMTCLYVDGVNVKWFYLLPFFNST